MILSDISFYLECISLLKPQYARAELAKKKQLATFLKTWLFYNSTSKNIYWTGYSTKDGMVERVKEHRYSNLATTRYLLERELPFSSKIDQVLWVFERMQWNYTSGPENKSMSKLQQYEIFYGKYNGDLTRLYKEAKIDLLEEKSNSDFLYLLRNLLCEGVTPKTHFVEVELDSKQAKLFNKGVDYAIEKLKADIKYIKVYQKGFIISGKTFTDIYKAVEAGYLSSMKMSELQAFALRYRYDLVENKGPYRLRNTFDSQPGRAFKVLVDKTPVYFSTYNGKKVQKALIEKIAEYFDSKIVLFDSNLNMTESV
jgi:hypothetical protein